MPAELIINASPYETRVALLEGGLVVEFYVERSLEKSIIGNIYKGRVTRVLPGMQAAFVDIGLERTAFIHAADIYNQVTEYEMMMLSRDTESETAGELPEKDTEYHPPASLNIEDLLHEGQDIIVQASKEPLGTKGARLTSYVTLAGRNLVLMPMTEHVGVSRRIEDEEERKRLKDIIEAVNPAGVGFIARTASEGVDVAKLQVEMDFLIRMWGNLQKKTASAPVPSLIYEDLDITLRAARDLFAKEVDRLIIDSPEEHQRVLTFMETFASHLKPSIELYTNITPIFDAYGIEVEMARALEKKVWLKSGGYIVIEMTEALTAIDINTGRFVGKRNLEETILKTNLEAVKEVAYQLRLRNIGGLIIIDFIDMKREKHREEVFNALREALRKDKSKTTILKMSELGLIEMTRKRTRESLGRLLCEPCFYCDGEGFLKSRRTICYEIFRKIERESADVIAPGVTISVHPDISEMFLNEEARQIELLERKIKKQITIQSHSDLHLEQYKISYN
ncbi:MAG: Rne/Rng family ribonuclease [Desulfovibrionales bacterium]|nr:Rne/Rng family ribonuclease [Desulfovibrionales bacterium]